MEMIERLCTCSFENFSILTTLDDQMVKSDSTKGFQVN